METRKVSRVSQATEKISTENQLKMLSTTAVNGFFLELRLACLIPVALLRISSAMGVTC